MGLLQLADLVPWSIAVNNLEESKTFYGESHGLEHVGRLHRVAKGQKFIREDFTCRRESSEEL